PALLPPAARRPCRAGMRRQKALRAQETRRRWRCVAPGRRSLPMSIAGHAAAAIGFPPRWVRSRSAAAALPRRVCTPVAARATLPDVIEPSAAAQLPDESQPATSATQRNPMFPVELSGVLWVRAATRYRLQYDA